MNQSLVKYDSENKFSGLGGFISSIKALNEVKITDELKNALKKMDTDGVTPLSTSLKKLKRGYNVSEESAIKYFKAVQNGTFQLKEGQSVLQGYKAYLKSIGRESQIANLKTKALSASMKVLSTIGWMAVFSGGSWAIGKGIEAVVNHISINIEIEAY